MFKRKKLFILLLMAICCCCYCYFIAFVLMRYLSYKYFRFVSLFLYSSTKTFILL